MVKLRGSVWHVGEWVCVCVSQPPRPILTLRAGGGNSPAHAATDDYQTWQCMEVYFCATLWLFLGIQNPQHVNYFKEVKYRSYVLLSFCKPPAVKFRPICPILSTCEMTIHLIPLLHTVTVIQALHGDCNDLLHCSKNGACLHTVHYQETKPPLCALPPNVHIMSVTTKQSADQTSHASCDDWFIANAYLLEVHLRCRPLPGCPLMN